MSMPLQTVFDFHNEAPRDSRTSVLPIDESFPEEAANELAALESYNKHLYRPNTYLHKWWARRSGTTFRHILKQLVHEPGKRDFYEPGGLEGKIIFDPMMGGGTTLHEAIRMGANVAGIDIDPIPVLQAKASLSISTLRHKQVLFSQFLDTLRHELSSLYETACPSCRKKGETQFVLYALRRRCSCGEVLFLDDLLLRQNNGHPVNICHKCRGVFTGKEHECRDGSATPLMVKGTKQCERCHERFSDILDDRFSQRYVPLVIAGTCQKHGTFFKRVAKSDLEFLDRARGLAEEIDFTALQDFRVSEGPKSGDLLRRGIGTYPELFTPRQLLYLDASQRFLRQVSDRDRLWITLLVSTSLEFNSLLCGYKGRDIRRPGAIRHVFSHHAYSFPYTALENNPLFQKKTSGTLNRIFNDRVARAAEWALKPVETRIVGERRTKVPIVGEIDGGESVPDWQSLMNGKRKFFVAQGDSAYLNIPENIVDYVVTDPPYFDSVQYSDLSNFFRVWLRLFLPNEADWCYDVLGSAVSEGDVSGGRKYGDVLSRIWKVCFKALKRKTGRLVFTFHHWRHGAWAELTISLKRARFFLVNRYVVFSENPISVHILGLKSLKHDAILVLKPHTADKAGRQWPKPGVINSTDSHTFCRDCGTAIGWFLDSDFTEEEIRQEWKKLLGGDGSGKASG